MLNDNEYTEFEDRKYLNPQVALDESNTFIDNLRNTQQANNQQIQTQTYNLGTAVPSNLGGLTGAESYFTSRYQTPQSASAVANLRATAQAAALNQVLANEQEMWKKRYNDAYRAYQKSVYDKSELLIDVNSGSNGTGTVSLNTNTGAGVYTPVTDYVGDYLSEDGSQWWQLGSLMQGDEISVGSNGVIQPKNGELKTVNGIDYMYLKNDQFPNGRWFRATRSAGPGTYSPYAGGD